MKKLYFDTEFTGLHQSTTLISIGIISDCGRTFYAEFTDYNKFQVNDWIQKNVISSLGQVEDNCSTEKYRYKKCISIGNTEYVRADLTEWISQFKDVEMWSDVLAYDWMLFNMLMADYSEGHPKLPRNVYYIPFDLATSFKEHGIDPDINREEFAETSNLSIEVLGMEVSKHNALWDAIVIKLCQDKIDNDYIVVEAAKTIKNNK